MQKVINASINCMQEKVCVFYSILFVPELFYSSSQLSSCCLEHYMIEISSRGYYIHLFQRQSDPFKQSEIQL